MKKFQIPFITIIVLILAGLLGGCAGGGTLTTSWPSITVDSQSETAFVSAGAQVYAVNLGNGSERWRFPEKADNKISFYGAPALTGDGQLVVGGYDDLLYSLNPVGGTQNWTFDGSTGDYIAGPLVSGERIFAPSADFSVYAVNPSGSLSWSFTTGNSLWATPSIDGILLYVPSMDHKLYALDAESGKLVWQTDDLGGSLAGSAILSADGAVLYLGTLGSEMMALDAATGKILWQIPTTGWVWSGPLLQDEVLYFGDLKGTLYAINAKDGSVRWQIQPNTTQDRSITGKPVIVEDTLFFADQSGNVYAVDIASGAVRWTKVIEGQLYADLATFGDMILLAPLKADAVLVALDLNGNPKWSFVPTKK